MKTLKEICEALVKGNATGKQGAITFLDIIHFALQTVPNNLNELTDNDIYDMQYIIFDDEDLNVNETKQWIVKNASTELTNINIKKISGTYTSGYRVTFDCDDRHFKLPLSEEVFDKTPFAKMKQQNI